MIYNVGDLLRIQNTEYKVIGKIQYMNPAEQTFWNEYRLRSAADNGEYWLSVDDVYREYSVSHVVRGKPDMRDYHPVDSGTESVAGAWGDVDVDRGEKAKFEEYEDPTEELIVSVEKWSDGTEYSVGYYIDEDEITKTGHIENMQAESTYQSSGGSSPAASKMFATVITVMIFLGALFSEMDFSFIYNLSSPKSIKKYLAKNTVMYSYSTSVTASNGLKADVYTAGYGSVEDNAKNIISGIEGNTENVMSSDEEGDDSVAIITGKEYCLVYLSEEEDQVYIQVSDRKYAYSSESEPYHSRSSTRSFYRRHYHSTGFWSDDVKYSKKYTSAYHDYSGGVISDVSSGSLNQYSGTVRQQSAAKRSSSGGGTSHGK